MSLLDRGPHILTVQRMKAAAGTYGETKTVEDGDPVTVRASVQPVSAEESYSLGLQALTAYKVICRSWPGGIHSKITWDGRVWSQRGETLHHTTGRLTQHDTAVIVANSAEVR